MEQGAYELNARWARLLIGEFVKCGVEIVAFASGYRNAPIVLAADAHPNLQCISHYDERGAAFFALGWGRATRRPAIWLTTSGTAAANGYPAVVEAAMDSVPLLCLTADRPAESRDTGANQVIDQHGLFGRYTRWFADIPSPVESIDWSYGATTVDHACFRAQDGPVHLNCQFRKPLVSRDEYYSDFGRPRPTTTYAAVKKTPPALDDLVEALRSIENGLVVAGRLGSSEEGAAAAHLAESLNWPLLPDIMSQVNPSRAHDTVCFANFELVLERVQIQGGRRADGILQIGGPFVSKLLLDYLDAYRPRLWAVVNPTSWRLDPRHRVTHRYEADVIPFCERLIAQMGPEMPDDGWISNWRQDSREIEQILARELDAAHLALTEPYVARTLLRLIPRNSMLFAGSSMPIRDLSVYRSTCQGENVFVTGNRGASGIDGTVATAAGLAEGSEKLVTMLLGDLALLHDLNSLALIQNRAVIIIALNNDGGGIFHLLGLPLAEDTIERCFGTPHGLDFEHAAGMFGLNYFRPDTREQFVLTYKQAASEGKPAIIEITTDRRQNAEEHMRLYDLVCGGPEA